MSLVNDALKKATLSSLAWKIFERGGSALVSLLVQIIMARLLAPEYFGALAIMLVLVNMGNIIVQSGLNTALVQAPRIDDGDCSTVFWLSLGISLVLCAVVFVCAPLVVEFYSMPEIVWPFRALGLLLIVNSFNAVQVAIVQRALEFKKVFNATIVSVFVSGVLGVGCAVSGWGLWSLVVQQLSCQFANCVVLALQVRWVPQFEFSFARAKALFSFGWRLLVSGLLDQGYQSLSDLVIGKQFSASSLGLVSQGKKYPQTIGSLLDGAIQPVMLSAVSRVQSDVSYAKRIVRRALKTSTFLVVPSMALFALVAEPLVRLLLGERWLPCVPFLQMYCFVYALLPIHTINLQTLNGMGRSDLFLKLELVKKAYGVAILLFAAFVLGDVYAMVAGYVLSGIVSTFVNTWPSKRVLGYSYGEQLRDMAPAFALAAASAAVAWPIGLLALPDAATVALQAAVMAGAYMGLSKALKVEAMAYLLSTVKEMVSARRDAS